MSSSLPTWWFSFFVLITHSLKGKVLTMHAPHALLDDPDSLLNDLNVFTSSHCINSHAVLLTKSIFHRRESCFGSQRSFDGLNSLALRSMI